MCIPNNNVTEYSSGTRPRTRGGKVFALLYEAGEGQGEV